jgi:microcystin-dependent protein
MAQKKITDLQLRTSVTSDLNLPSDDGIQSYRITAQQLADFILANGSVTASKLGTGAVTTTKILDANVTLAKLATEVAYRLTPAGSILNYSGTTAPDGYLLCDGSAVSRTTYAALFAAIGTTFGVGDGSTTFNVPLRYSEVHDQAYTPTMTGFGTVASNFAQYSVRSGMIKVIGRFTSGTSTATEARIALPTGYVTKTFASMRQVGVFAMSAASASQGRVLAEGGSQSYVTLGFQSATQPGTTRQNGSSIINSGDALHYEFEVSVTSSLGQYDLIKI